MFGKNKCEPTKKWESVSDRERFIRSFKVLAAGRKRLLPKMNYRIIKQKPTNHAGQWDFWCYSYLKE